MDTPKASLLLNGAPPCSSCVLEFLQRWWTCLVTPAAHQLTKFSFPPPPLTQKLKRGHQPLQQPLKVCYSGINFSKNKLSSKNATVKDIYDSSLHRKCEKVHRKSTLEPTALCKTTRSSEILPAAYTELIYKLLEPQPTFERMYRPNTNFLVYDSPMSPTLPNSDNRRPPQFRRLQPPTEAAQPPLTSQTVHNTTTSVPLNLLSTSTPVEVLTTQVHRPVASTLVNRLPPTEPSDWATTLVLSVTEFVLADDPPIPGPVNPPTYSLVASPSTYAQVNFPNTSDLPFEPMNRHSISTRVDHTINSSVFNHAMIDSRITSLPTYAPVNFPNTYRFANPPFPSEPVNLQAISTRVDNNSVFTRAMVEDVPTTSDQINCLLASLLVNCPTTVVPVNRSLDGTFCPISASTPQGPMRYQSEDPRLFPQPLDWISTPYRTELPYPPAPFEHLANLVPADFLLAPESVDRQFSMGNCPNIQLLNFPSTYDPMDPQFQPGPLDWICRSNMIECLELPAPFQQITSFVQADNLQINPGMVDCLPTLHTMVGAENPAPIQYFANCVPVGNLQFYPGLVNRFSTADTIEGLETQAPIECLTNCVLADNIHFDPGLVNSLSTDNTMKGPEVPAMFENQASFVPATHLLYSETPPRQPTSEALDFPSTPPLLEYPPANILNNFLSTSEPMNQQLNPGQIDCFSTSDTMVCPKVPASMEQLVKFEPTGSLLTSESVGLQPTISLGKCATDAEDFQSTPVLLDCPSASTLTNLLSTSKQVNLQLSPESVDCLSTPDRMESSKALIPIENLASVLPADSRVVVVESACASLNSSSAAKLVNPESALLENTSAGAFVNPSLTAEPLTDQPPSAREDLSNVSDSEDNLPSTTECVDNAASNALDCPPTSDIVDNPIDECPPSTSATVDHLSCYAREDCPPSSSVSVEQLTTSSLKDSVKSAPGTVDHLSTYACEDCSPTSSVPVDQLKSSTQEEFVPSTSATVDHLSTNVCEDSPPTSSVSVDQLKTSTVGDSVPSISEIDRPSSAAVINCPSSNVAPNAPITLDRQTYMLMGNLPRSELQARPPRPPTKELFMFVELDLPVPTLALISLACVRKLSLGPTPGTVCRPPAPQIQVPSTSNPSIINSNNASEYPGLVSTNNFPNTSRPGSYSVTNTVLPSYSTPFHFCPTFTGPCTDSPNVIYAAPNAATNNLQSINFRAGSEQAAGNNYSRGTESSRGTHSPSSRNASPCIYSSRGRYSRRGTSSSRNRNTNRGIHSNRARYCDPGTSSPSSRFDSPGIHFPNGGNASPETNSSDNRCTIRVTYSSGNRNTNRGTNSYRNRHTTNRGPYSNLRYASPETYSANRYNDPRTFFPNSRFSGP